MNKNPFAGKSTRTKIFTVISIVAILLVMVLNIWLAKFIMFGNAYIDMTPEGLYTLTPEMEKACGDVFDTLPGEIEIIFCNDRDYILDETLTRVPYYMSLAIAKRFDKCSVDSVNVKMNPTAVAKYRTTSLTEITSNNIIITYTPSVDDGTSSGETRYRIVSAENFWRIMSDNTVFSYDGEYQMMSYLLSLTLVDRPAAYFVTDHGETYYDVTDPNNPMNTEIGSFVDLLHDRGFEIKNLALSEVDEIPEDCVLLIINNPTIDFRYDADKATSLAYVSETEILDRYMTDERGSIMVSLDYAQSLPNLEDFLAEWGIECTGYKVTDKVNYVENSIKDDISTLIADYDLDTESYAYQIYGDYADMASSPRFIVHNVGSLKTAYGIGSDANEPGSANTRRIFTPFLYSSVDSQAHAYVQHEGQQSGAYTALASEGKQVLAALGSRQTTDSDSGDLTFSYVFCAASPNFFAEEYLGNTSYANFDIISALVQNICRLDTLADDSLGGGSMNGDKFYGKQIVDTAIRAEDVSENFYDDDGSPNQSFDYGLTAKRRNGIMIVIFVIPVLIAAVGVFVCVKRKYL